MGTDPYTQAISDVYQDLAGRGATSARASTTYGCSHRLLGGRFPDALLLSHDLVEGSYVRVALATDVELYDQFPSSYLVYAGRQHRWIRVGRLAGRRLVHAARPGGLALGHRRVPNPISTFQPLEDLDNLRRSLVPVANTTFC